MSNGRRRIVLWLTLTFIIGALLLVGEACDPAVPLQIENRTDMALNIYVEGVNVGEVEPNNNIRVKNLAATKSYYLIEAKNSKGEAVHSRQFSFTELNDRDWKVVIPPLENE